MITVDTELVPAVTVEEDLPELTVTSPSPGAALVAVTAEEELVPGAPDTVTAELFAVLEGDVAALSLAGDV